MDPPADVDKSGVPSDNSCWMATASNMLAGAGYGTGTTLQDRAEDIYNDMIVWQTTALNPTGLANGGWTDAALQWWLSSANNTWPANPYKNVTVYGNKFPKYPWANVNGAQFIGNELRRCQFVGLSISWPLAGATIGSGGHAITAWGDNGGSGTLTTNPINVRVTDSDNENGGDVQSYIYDTYTSPNPSGANEGNGWYIDYDPNHPYIKHIVTLCPTDVASGNSLIQKVVGSIKVHQDKEIDATDLHYTVSTDVEILSYKTTIDWNTSNSPVITESNPRRKLTVDWDLTDKPVPYCNWITINTEFILPAWNAIKYNDVHFTYPKDIKATLIPKLGWKLETPVIKKIEAIPNITGGYVVGSFNVIDPKLNTENKIVCEYRFIHEYNFNQNPEEHLFILEGVPEYIITNLHFGHTYGYLSTNELWKFEDWMTSFSNEKIELGEKPIEIRIDWQGKLPYPEGENIKGRIREIKER